MKFTFELDLSKQHSVGFVVGYMESLSEGLLEKFGPDYDIREIAADVNRPQYIICEAGVDASRTTCDCRMTLSTAEFEAALGSYQQIAETGAKGSTEIREVREYKEGSPQ